MPRPRHPPSTIHHTPLYIIPSTIHHPPSTIHHSQSTWSVRYGLDGVYTYQDSDGWIELENFNFNDPVLGSRKRGWCNVNSDLTICDSALCRNPRAPGCEGCRAVQQCTCSFDAILGTVALTGCSAL